MISALRGEGGTHSPTGNSHPGGALCIASRQILTTFQTRSCVNSWRIFVRRLHFMSCMDPPAILNQHLGENHQGAVILMGMTRRPPSKRGRVCSPETTISISYPSVTRWRMGSSGTTSTTPKACSGESRCGVPNQHIGIGVMLGYPKNKHLQW